MFQAFNAKQNSFKSVNLILLFKHACMALCLWGLAMGAAQADSGQFIIKLKNAVELSSMPTVRRLDHDGQELADLMQRNGVDATWLRPGAIGIQVMKWGPSVRESDKQALLNRLRSDPDVEFVQEDRPVRAFATPTDSQFSNQWDLRSLANTAGAKFDQAWDMIRGSAAVVVAVIDTGVVFSTPDLSGRLLSGYDFISDSATANDGDGRDADPSDPGNWVSQADTQTSQFSGCSVSNSSWHGTFVAGEIAADTNNQSDIAGADWNVKILPIRALGKCGGSLSDVLDGMLWAAGISVPGVPNNTNPAAVINLSLGSASSCSTYEQSVVDRVTSAGTLVVAAAGNGGGAVESPANCNGVMAVGALDKDGSRAYYSAVGNGVTLMAPGGYYDGIVGLGNSGTTTPSSPTLVTKTGTSFSAPLVAATGALLKSVNPALSPAQIRNYITQNTSPFLAPASQTCTANSGYATCNCTTAVCGAGMLNAFAAVKAARGNLPLANAVSSNNGLVTSGYQPASASSNVILNGSSSTAGTGNTIASYAWQQVSGETLMTGTNTNANVTLPPPQNTTDLVFKLTVTDSVGQSHTSYTALRVVASGGSSSSPTVGTTGGSSTPTATSSTSSSGSSGGGGGGGGGGALSFYGLAGLALLLAALRKANSKAA